MEMGNGQMELGPCTVSYRNVPALLYRTMPHRRHVPYHHGQGGQYMQVPGLGGSLGAH